MEFTSDAVYAFVDSIEKAHRVARHIYLQDPSEVWVGFNESKGGEGYVRVHPSIDIAQIVRAVTGEEPIRILTHDQITAEPDMWGLQATWSDNDASGSTVSE